VPDEHARRLCGVLEELKTSLPTMIADRAPSRDLRVSGSILIEFFRVRTNTAPREFSNQSFRMQTGAEKRGFRCGPVWLGSWPWVGGLTTIVAAHQEG
jgi:hypothetical protein